MNEEFLKQVTSLLDEIVSLENMTQRGNVASKLYSFIETFHKQQSAERKQRADMFPNTKEGIFYDVVMRMYETYQKKNADYGGSFSETFAKRGYDYFLGMIETKIARIDTLSKNPAKVQGESMKDSMLDGANYFVLGLVDVIYNETHGSSTITN